jgi:hypothetical protein
LGLRLSEQNLHPSLSGERIEGKVVIFIGVTFMRIPPSIFLYAQPVPLFRKTSPQIIGNTLWHFDLPDDSKERALRTVSVRLASNIVKKLCGATFDLRRCVASYWGW